MLKNMRNKNGKYSCWYLVSSEVNIRWHSSEIADSGRKQSKRFLDAGLGVF